MRTTKLIDALPSLFGALAIVGLVTAAYHLLDTSLLFGVTIGTVILYGGGALTLIVGLISLIQAMTSHQLNKIHYLNIGWIILPGLYFLLLVALLFTYYFVPPWKI
jgi:hypothetical protein